MSLSFAQIQQQFQQLMATQSRLIGLDIGAVKKEQEQLRLVCYELMNHVSAITKALQDAKLYTPPEPITSQEAPADANTKA
jgi:hypothetical protein